MLGSLQKKGKAYYVVYDEGRDPVTNKRSQKWVSLGTNDKTIAEAKYSDMVKKINMGEYITPSKMTVHEYIDKWLKHIRAKVRPSTYDSYNWAANHIKKGLGTCPVDKLKPLHIEEHLTNAAASELSSTSVRYQYNILREALTQAVKWQLLSINPCAAIDPPRKEKYKASVFTPDQLQLLLDKVAGTNIHLPVVLAVGCGLRRGETCGLRWEDVDLLKGLLFVRNSLDWEDGELTLRPVKTSTSERSIKLPQLALSVLKKEKVHQAADKMRAGDLYQKKDYCWAWDDGRPHDPDYLYRTFQKLLKRHNKEIDADTDLSDKQKEERTLPIIRFHDLRHSHATFLMLAGVPVKVISERLGHSSTSVTQNIYSHVLPQMQEQAANEVDRLLVSK